MTEEPAKRGPGRPPANVTVRVGWRSVWVEGVRHDQGAEISIPREMAERMIKLGLVDAV